MDPDLGETQRLLQTTLRGFLEEHVPFDRVREHERKGRADEDLWQALADQGFLGAALPEAVGGGNAGLPEAGICVHEVARRAAIVPMVETTASALCLARSAAADESALLHEIVAGRCIPVPALFEASDDAAGATRVDADGRLHGSKGFVDYAQDASHHLVSARDPQGESLYLVERADPALQTRALAPIGRTPQSTVHYDGAVARRVGDAAACAALARHARALTCAQILGCMEVALEMTVAYTNVRVQFGQPLSAFQAVQHHAANMAMLVESSRFMVYEMLDALERSDADDEQVALVKASVSRAVPEVTMLAHQLHGGQGLIEENDLYFFSLRGKDRSVAWGSAEECLDEVARHVESPPRWL